MKRLILLSFCCLVLPLFSAAQDVDTLPGKKLKVLTQNLYVGADLIRILAPEAGNPFCDPVVTPLCIPATVDSILGTIADNDFTARAEALAQRIKAEKPDVIGLQEVTLLRRQSPGDFLINGMVDADEVIIDYLDVLLDALDDLGAKYEVAAIVVDADVELPWLVGFDGPNPLLDDARLTDRDVILVRKNIPTANAASENYSVNLMFEVAGVPVEFTRGFAAVDARVRGEWYRIVNTHLEIQEDTIGGLVQAAQAAELIGLLSTETLPVVLLGDFNSSPEDPPGQPYSQLLAANYVDMWDEQDDPGDGFTCCQNEDLLNGESVLSERVDIVFVRNDLGFLPESAVGPLLCIHTIGDEVEDKTSDGLWPSDHAGVLAKMRVPRLVLD